MERNTVIPYTRNGLGEGPGKPLFHGEGVNLACADSPVLESLLEISGRERICCYAAPAWSISCCWTEWWLETSGGCQKSSLRREMR